jgi:hypothetical protein
VTATIVASRAIDVIFARCGRIIWATPRAEARSSTTRRRRAVVLPEEQQAIESGSAGVEEVAGAIGRERHVRDEGQSLGAHL